MNKENIDVQQHAEVTYETIMKSELFDREYYLSNNPDVKIAGVDPIEHYISYGASEGRNPSFYFDTTYYLDQYSDLDERRENPLFHYVKKGWKEGKNPSLFFDTNYYLDNNEDVKNNGMNPLLHFIKHGKKSGRLPQSLEKQKSYLLDSYKHNLSLSESNYEDMVSIIVLNLNGESHLKTLFSSILSSTVHSNYQIVIVDHASTDDSIEIIEEYKKHLPIVLERKNYNDTFSISNNEAAIKYPSDFYVFLNNDIEVTFGWLTEMLRVYKTNSNVGAVGAKLLYPIEHPQEAQRLQPQHAGIKFRHESGFYRPYNYTDEDSYLAFSSDPVDFSAVTAALLMIDRETFVGVKGFDEGYNYGYEDVDLSLQVKKAGKKVLYAPSVLAFHHEFGTQKTSERSEVVTRRTKNIEHFRSKWLFFLKQAVFNEKLNNKDFMYTDSSLTVAILVTDNDKDTPAGDYFTAKEFGDELKSFGWDVRYLSRIKGEWEKEYSDIDILISMIHGFNPATFKTKKPVLKVAWARNWFDKWCDYGIQYDIVYASSHLACDYMKDKLNCDVKYLPIATNNKRFHPELPQQYRFKSDYCFTGSYWGVHREIIDLLNPQDLPNYNFAIYGKGWEDVEKFREFHRGFISYHDIPLVYSNTKIVIDDANHVTKPFGSVNSRVFDAIASGVLVITNGKLGSLDIFEGKLPYFETREELTDLLSKFLSDDNARVNLINELQGIVFENNLYAHRANTVRADLIDYFNKERFIIKLPVPMWEQKDSWGDFHYGVAIKKHLELNDYPTKLQILPDWDDPEGLEYENVLVLRGLSKYITKANQYNIMWNISHPDKITLEEYNSYDTVYVASELWANIISSVSTAKIKTLFQCTDVDLFKIPTEEEKQKYKSDILFVGNSRGIYRDVVKKTIEILPELEDDIDFKVYGNGWADLVDPQYLGGDNIPNTELYKYYGSAKVVINDHWSSMKKLGFVSNRTFDVLASGGMLVSDFCDLNLDVEIYDSASSLKEIYTKYLVEEKATNNSSKWRESVLEYSFSNAVNFIINDITIKCC